MRVLSIVGPGRSGSTVLAHLLGEVDGVVAAGEVRWLFRRGIVERRPCGCDRPPLECPVWGPVIDAVPMLAQARTSGGEDGLVAAARRIAAWQGEIVGLRRRRELLALPSPDRQWPQLAAYVAVMGDLYRAIAEVTGAEVVVDSSKRPQDAAVAVLAMDPGATELLHLVRDPRAVAHSWTRRKVSAGGTEMGRNPPIKAALRWDEMNLGAQRLCAAVGDHRSSRLRYEDFVAAPGPTLERIVARILPDGGAAELPMTGTDTAVLTPNHAVMGNPDRFRTGETTIRNDVRWRTDQPVAHRLLVTALTAPLLGRHGYPLTPGDGDAATVRPPR